MESKGIIDRFNVHPVLMLTYLQPKDQYIKQEKSRNEPESDGFNSILQRKISMIKS